MFDQYDEVLTVSQLMEVLGIGKNVAYQLLNSGQIQSFKIGRVHRIPKKAVINYITNQCRSRYFSLNRD